MNPMFLIGQGKNGQIPSSLRKKSKGGES